MTAPHIIGEIRSHEGMAGLHALFRTRAEGLQLSREALNNLSGLHSGFVSKLLAPVPLKNFGTQSFGPLMGGVAVKLS